MYILKGIKKDCGVSGWLGSDRHTAFDLHHLSRLSVNGMFTIAIWVLVVQPIAIAPAFCWAWPGWLVPLLTLLVSSASFLVIQRKRLPDSLSAPAGVSFLKISIISLLLEAILGFVCGPRIWGSFLRTQSSTST